MEAGQPKPAPRKALAHHHAAPKKSPLSLAVVVTLCAHLKKELDDDNLVGSLKPLRDAISRDIGLDDGDQRIKFQYCQVRTKGEEGVAVTVEKSSAAP